VTQRFVAALDPGELAFSLRLIRYLVRKPIWFIGILSMILGFVFLGIAPSASGLSLVQPVIAAELLFVFAFWALGGRMVQRRDWIAASVTAIGLGCCLGIAHPTAGSDDVAITREPDGFRASRVNGP
jgi:hypothetical protein